MLNLIWSTARNLSQQQRLRRQLTHFQVRLTDYDFDFLWYGAHLEPRTTAQLKKLLQDVSRNLEFPWKDWSFVMTIGKSHTVTSKKDMLEL